MKIIKNTSLQTFLEDLTEIKKFLDAHKIKLVRFKYLNNKYYGFKKGNWIFSALTEVKAYRKLQKYYSSQAPEPSQDLSYLLTYLFKEKSKPIKINSFQANYYSENLSLFPITRKIVAVSDFTKKVSYLRPLERKETYIYMKGRILIDNIPTHFKFTTKELEHSLLKAKYTKNSNLEKFLFENFYGFPYTNIPKRTQMKLRYKLAFILGAIQHSEIKYRFRFRHIDESQEASDEPFKFNKHLKTFLNILDEKARIGIRVKSRIKPEVYNRARFIIWTPLSTTPPALLDPNAPLNEVVQDILYLVHCRQLFLRTKNKYEELDYLLPSYYPVRNLERYLVHKRKLFKRTEYYTLEKNIVNLYAKVFENMKQKIPTLDEKEFELVIKDKSIDLDIPPVELVKYLFKDLEYSEERYKVLIDILIASGLHRGYKFLYVKHPISFTIQYLVLGRIPPTNYKVKNITFPVAFGITKSQIRWAIYMLLLYLEMDDLNKRALADDLLKNYYLGDLLLNRVDDGPKLKRINLA